MLKLLFGPTFIKNKNGYFVLNRSRIQKLNFFYFIKNTVIMKQKRKRDK
jgi:hypothetical protein